MTREEILEVAKPILFNTDMVRAILEGRKSNIRGIWSLNDVVTCSSVWLPAAGVQERRKLWKR